jgi:hypothetical protein
MVGICKNTSAVYLNFLGLVSESDFSRTSRTEQPSDCPVRLVYYSPTMSDSRTEVGQSDVYMYCKASKQLKHER